MVKKSKDDRTEKLKNEVAQEIGLSGHKNKKDKS